MTSDTHDRDRDRLEELLTERALKGLSVAEADELRGLQLKLGAEDDPSLDAAAAILALGLTGRQPVEPLPADLRSKLETGATEFFAPPVIPLPEQRTRPAGRSWGWLAAAACLALAVWAWWPSQGDLDVLESPAAMRSRLLAGADDQITRMPWTATEDAAASEASGDVVWNNAQQEGYMRFQGLPANDTGTYQYQLWIFDAARDDRYPIDGGVFDIPAGAEEVIIPIRPGLPIGDAVLFAVTIEKPGGVVVSSRERLVVLADMTAAGGS